MECPVCYSTLVGVRSQTEAGVGAGDVVEELLRVLADHGLLVVAGDVVPRDAVVVHVVEHAHARLGRAVDVELCVVGLADLLVPGLRPRVVAPAVGDLKIKLYVIFVPNRVFGSESQPNMPKVCARSPL